MGSTGLRSAWVLVVCISLYVVNVYANEGSPAKEPPGVAELPAACLAAKADFRPLGQPDLLAAKEELKEAAARLDRRLSTAGNKGLAWREYVQLYRLQEQLQAPEAPELPVLDRIYNRFAAGHEGLGLTSFSDVRQALRQYLIVARAIGNPQLKADYGVLLEGLAERLKASAAKPTTEEALAIGDALRWLAEAQQAPALVEAIRRHYNCPNLVLTASADIVAAGIARPVDDTAPVRDFILGTSIYGTGHTTGQTTAALFPDHKRGVVDIIFLGTTKSQNVGYHGPVQIYMDATTPIGACKRLWINPEGVAALPAVSNAVTRTTINGIQSNRGRRLVERMAWKRTFRQKAQAEYIAARHAEGRINRRIDQQTVEMVQRANKRYVGQIRKPLLWRELFPQQVRFSTTKEALRIVALRADSAELAAPAAPPLAGQADLTLCVHESMINNLAAGGLSGVIMPDKRFQSAITDLWGKLPERFAAQEGEEPWTIVFARQNPIRVSFADDGFSVTIRGRRYYKGENRHPGMDVTAVYKIVKGEQGFQAIRQGDLQIVPPGFVPGSGKRLSARQTVIRTLLQRRFGRIFDARILLEDMTLPGDWEKAGKMRPVHLACQGGWLVVAWNRVAAGRPADTPQ